MSENDALVNASATIAAASVKLPEFWIDQPSVWFVQAESNFALTSVTRSRTKFDYVVAALPQRVIVSLLDVVQAPPVDTPYETLKERLLANYTLTKYQRASFLVHQPALGDRKPSVLMSDMLALLPPDHKPDFLFNFLFLERLPADVRKHLVTSEELDPRKLALLADGLCGTTTNHAAPLHQVDQDVSYEEYEDGFAAAVPRKRSSRPPPSSFLSKVVLVPQQVGG